MIENFEMLKKQLKELSEIINAFKSEAVQLRIIDLIFGAPVELPEVQVENKNATTKLKKQAPKKKKPQKTKNTNSILKKRTPSGGGAVATLTQLFEEGFFEIPKTINDFIQHCDTNLARKFKANDISGKLARMVRNGELTREKNADNQYEYKKL